MDEPTNHLDMESIESLNTALDKFAGTLLFISHDRSFINALATRVVDVRGGVLDETLGNYDDYLRSRGATSAAPPAAGEPPPPAAGDAAKRERIEARQRAKDEAREHGRAKKRLADLEREIAALEERP